MPAGETVTKAEAYRRALAGCEGWDRYLLDHSGLPGPRGNLELAQAVADSGGRALFERYLEYDAARAPANSPEEFLAFCGVLGLGRLLAEGDRGALPVLRARASDPRWRTREGVAMALQRWGDADLGGLLGEMADWARGTPLEQRAAAAALCEPRLLRDPADVERVLALLDGITRSVQASPERRSEEFRALRQGLGYCWSVAIAAHLAAGKPHLEKWLDSDDADVRWIVRENLRKKRLERMDGEWVASCRARLG
jgi:hypothetical protein